MGHGGREGAGKGPDIRVSSEHPQPPGPHTQEGVCMGVGVCCEYGGVSCLRTEKEHRQ